MNKDAFVPVFVCLSSYFSFVPRRPCYEVLPAGLLKERNTETSKIMTNNTNNISADSCMIDKKLEEVTSFKYLGTTLCKNGTCSAEIRIRIASAMLAMV